MQQLYLVGEPFFRPEPKEEYYAPIGQLELCQKILKETQDKTLVLDRLRKEYLAIVWTLKQMEIDFRIIYAHGDQIDKKVLGVCTQELGCKLAGFDQGYFAPSVIYPRDFATVLPGLVLVNSEVVDLKVRGKDDYKILPSPYGEGGRVLFSEKTILITERLAIKEGHSRPVEPRDIAVFSEMGIKVGILPFPVSRSFSLSGPKNKSFGNDHIDRVACLIRGKERKLHLVVDPLIHTTDWKDYKHVRWMPRFPRESMEKIEHTCEAMGINVCYPKGLEVPYSLNLIQFPDSRVLMTGGDETVAEIIGEIVGKENLFKTPIPIRFFPVWAYAGIRCLVSEAPMILFKRLNPL